MLDPSLFVSAEVHARTVTLPDGSAHELWFRELPAVEFRRLHLAETSSDEDTRVASMARLIAACVCDPGGKPAMTPKQALQLRPAAANAILRAVLQVNGLGEEQPDPKPQGALTGSGTSSPSPSEAAPLANGSAP